MWASRLHRMNRLDGNAIPRPLADAFVDVFGSLFGYAIDGRWQHGSPPLCERTTWHRVVPATYILMQVPRHFRLRDKFC